MGLATQQQQLDVNFLDTERQVRDEKSLKSESLDTWAQITKKWKCGLDSGRLKSTFDVVTSVFVDKEFDKINSTLIQKHVF